MKIKTMLIISISIILLAIFLQVIPSSFTGMSTKINYYPTTIEISPKVVIHEETLKIKVSSPYKIYNNKKEYSWIGNKIYFYIKNSRKGEKVLCSSNKCRGNFTVEYEVPAMMYTGSNWQEGVYIAKIYDYLNKKYVETSFRLVNISNSLIVCKETDRGNDISHKGTTYSYLTGTRVKKEDKCIEVYGYDGASSKELGEYYCCKKEDKNYVTSIGMCYKIIPCNQKCEKGNCWG